MKLWIVLLIIVILSIFAIIDAKRCIEVCIRTIWGTIECHYECDD